MLREIEGHLGLSSGTIKSLDETLPEWEPISEEEAVRRILAYNPELIVLDREIERAEANLEWQKSRAWPDVTAGVGYARGDRAKGGRMVRDDFVMAFVEVPFPVVDRNQGLRGQAYTDILIMSNELKVVVYDLMNQWNAIKNKITNLKTQYTVFFEKIVNGKKLILKKNDILFQQGKLSRINSIKANLKYIEAVFKLLLFEEMLKQVVVNSKYIRS